MPFSLRRMKAEDLAAVLAIERVSFPNPWPATTFLGEIQNTTVSHPYVAVSGSGDTERLIGYVIFWLISDEAQINNIALLPEFRRRGMGESLMRQTLDMIRDLGGSYVILEVRQSNQAALSLYLKLGFSEIGRRPSYYFNPEEDALVMGLGL
ncbi:MAG TPA: ribosomal protein S18-alanine N-acetyltransferase [Acidobacteriota bacterium]